MPTSSLRKESVHSQDHLHQTLQQLVHDLINCGVDLTFAKKELETVYIREVLARNGGNIGQSAQALGMHRNTLSKYMKRLKISVER